MYSFRFLHAADLHLDSPFRGLSDIPQAIRERIQESTFKALDQLVETALHEHVDFVVIAGDLYDAEDRSVRAQLRIHQAMERLASEGIAVYIAHGNHDPLDGKRMQWEAPERVRVFSGNEVETCVVTDRSGRTLAHVHGISFPTASVTDNLAAKFHVQDASVYNIAVLHTNVDGSSDHDNYAPSTRAQLIHTGMDYWALGHIHARRVLHEEPFIVYPGNAQGRSMKETGAKGCYLVEVGAGKSTKLTFCPLDQVRWLDDQVEIEHCSTELQLKQLIEDSLERLSAQTDGRPCVVRLTLQGRSELYHLLMNSSLLEELANEWNREQAYFAESDRTYPFIWLESCKLDIQSAVDREALAGQDSFVGDMLRLAEKWCGDPAALNAVIEEAARELMLARPGKYLRDRQAGRRTGGQASGVLPQLDGADHEQLLALAEALLLDMLVDGEAVK